MRLAHDVSSVLDAPEGLQAFVVWGDGTFGGRTRENLAVQAITNGKTRNA